jgi:hypothetical protein
MEPVPGSTVNPHTGRPYTQRYLDILKKRMTLPVYEHKVCVLVCVCM